MAETMVGLAIRLRGSHFLQVVMPSAQALEIIKWWSDETYLRSDVKFVYGTSHLDGSHWAVRLEDVVCMHTFEPEALQAIYRQEKAKLQQTPTGRMPLTPWSRSG